MAEALRNDDLGYPIVVGKNLRSEIADFARARGPARVLLCDANRHVLAFGQTVAKMLGNPPVLAFRLGETQKRLNTVEHVLDAMGAEGVERSSLVVGVGGGVASDLFGFACATYMRGIAYGHVATSLVAMVDAAIGGKTGVNLRAGKNLAGCFRDPVAVFCDVAALSSLSRRGFAEGLAEIVKAGVIEGGDFFEALEELAPHPLARWPWEHVIESAIKVKTMTVADDRHEAGTRELLNLGHTFAHAFERASQYRMTHGEAVAIGLRAAGLLALRTGRFSEAEHLRVITLLTLLRLPLQTALTPEAVLAAMSSDKKKRSGRLRFVLPRSIGDVEYGVECSGRSVLAVLAALQEAPEKLRARR
jgi:3-dehydroquinate synthetase